MTELLYLSDSYTREFEATVSKVGDGALVLDRTAFYPGGGGQPCDTGTLTVAEDVLHHLDGEPPAIGARVKGAIDWERRYRLMRTHTALHVLCGVVWRDFGAKVTGGDMKPLEARMDFELERMSADFAREVEELINREVEAGRPVETGTLSREKALRNPDLIRTKTNLLPEGIEEVRVIDIVGLDIQADGGTHVANTKEVGRIRVVKHESKGRINKRLRIAVEESPRTAGR